MALAIASESPAGEAMKASLRSAGMKSSSRAARLEAVAGWVWDQKEAEWEEAFARLAAYVEEFGDGRVPYRYHAPDGALLGVWVGRQRATYRKGGMSAARVERLEAVAGWVWDQKEA